MSFFFKDLNGAINSLDRVVRTIILLLNINFREIQLQILAIIYNKFKFIKSQDRHTNVLDNIKMRLNVSKSSQSFLGSLRAQLGKCQLMITSECNIITQAKFKQQDIITIEWFGVRVNLDSQLLKKSQSKMQLINLKKGSSKF